MSGMGWVGSEYAKDLSFLRILYRLKETAMDASAKSKLIATYRRYGFNLARDQSKDNILVFTLKTGYFDNAEILKLSNDANTTGAFSEFSKAGYACTIREPVIPEQVEEILFQGFFSAEITRERLLDDYRRFSGDIAKPYGQKAEYTYIHAPYQINGKAGTSNVPNEVISRMPEAGPILFLIEAAAGFGKTCTALEVVKLLAQHPKYLPLYAELSRNRQARIFKHILLDEIDRTFPLLSSALVNTEIKSGRIAAILDGFDELLRKNEQTGEFENSEPMLETVSEYLTGNAKVIITTRRTVLFDGDEFHQWLERHAESFKVIRIRIQEPRVSDWLGKDRLETLTNTGLKIESMANPVLLSYLRYIEDSSFTEIARTPEKIVDSYFSYMLERERARQDLRMSVELQSQILQSVAKDMMNSKYTAEKRDYIVNLILTAQAKSIDETRAQYPSAEKPSREEIANKLASHALLDRNAQSPDKISFINEFALGHYVSANILDTDGWLDDDLRFIDPAVRSYIPRGEDSRRLLYDQLSNSLPYLDMSSQIEITAELINEIPNNLTDDAAESLILSNLELGSHQISNFQFNECHFKKCTFKRENLRNVTFLNCKFYECKVEEGSPTGTIYVLGGISNPDISQALSNSSTETSPHIVEQESRDAEISVIRKLWPIGESLRQRPSRPIYRPIKTLCRPIDGLSSELLYEATERLIRAGILLEKSKSGLITINFEMLHRIDEIIGDIA